jgi:hypothetical protein
MFLADELIDNSYNGIGSQSLRRASTSSTDDNGTSPAVSRGIGAPLIPCTEIQSRCDECV